jgi:hypothetical protein
VQAPKKQAPPIRQISWSVWESGWQLSQENVPLSEAKAFANAIRPRRTGSGVGSLPTPNLVVWAGAAGFETSTTETVFSSVLST